MSTIDESLVHAPHVRPCGSQVVVIPIREERKQEQTASGIWIDTRVTHGGVHLTDETDLTPCEGRIVAVGDGKRDPIPYWLAERFAKIAEDETRYPDDSLEDRATRVKLWANQFVAASSEAHVFEVKVGDRVLWRPWGAVTTVTLNDVAYFILDESEILARFED